LLPVCQSNRIVNNQALSSLTGVSIKPSASDLIALVVDKSAKQ
jgi:hypothetical protein